LFWITFAVALILIALSLIFVFVMTYPEWQVSQSGINNVTEKTVLVNQYRTTLIQLLATFAQILGGGAVAIGIYFAWGNLTTARDGQITERFTRAVDQLGNRKMEIRLGGIYALGRISNESDKDYWPIMEILTAYIRMNSSVEVVKNKKVVTIQPIAKKRCFQQKCCNSQDNKGAPLSAAKIASMTFKLFFLTVDMYALILQKATAPSMLRKVPEIFCCSFIILMSRSA